MTNQNNLDKGIIFSNTFYLILTLMISSVEEHQRSP